MLKAMAQGETSPATLAALADKHLRATPEQLCDALGACTELNVVYRRLLGMALQELQLIDEQIGRLDQEMATLLSYLIPSGSPVRRTSGLVLVGYKEIDAVLWQHSGSANKSDA